MTFRYSWPYFMTEHSDSSECLPTLKPFNVFIISVIKTRNIRRVGNAECSRMNLSLYKFWGKKKLN